MPVLSAQGLLGFALFDLMLILIVGRSVGTLFRKIGQPRVVGEIVAGVLLGPILLGHSGWPGFITPGFLHCVIAPGMPSSPTSCLFPAAARTVIGQLGQLGLLLFSFLTAVELDRTLLRSRTRGIALLGPGSVLLPIALAVPLGPVLATPVFKPAAASTLDFTLFVGVLLAATALPVMVRILQERGLSRSPLGCTGIAASAVATVGLFVAASVVSSIANTVCRGGAASVGRALGLAASYFGLMLLVVRPLLTRVAVLNRVAARPGDAGTSGVFVAVLAVVLASGLAAHLTGLTVIVGGFVGLSWAESNVLGILMNCPGVIVLVVALIGVQNGVITPTMQAGVVLVALVATAMTGPLLNVFLHRLPAASLIPAPLPAVRRLLP